MNGSSTGGKLDYITYAVSGVVAALELVSATIGNFLGSAFMFMQTNASGVTACIVLATFIFSQVWHYRNDRRARARELREAAEHRQWLRSQSMLAQSVVVVDKQQQEQSNLNTIGKDEE